ncbi:hypothetical protein N752_01845 [Desulforamulus aquiferis]|nr:sporulation protein YtxC [Desulforamulus aquiferis]RYD06895.1 hypothetical protein N752_01845 [Desulforamulus aquiferis]
MDNEINYEDLLISALITIAPNKIVFHTNLQDQPETTMETIKSVFAGRVSECSGCTLCKNQQQ